MKVNLAMVPTTTDPLMEISDSIKAGTWDNVERDVDLYQFVMQPDVSVGYIIDPDKTLQVRGYTMDFSFVDRQVMKVKTTGDKSGLKMPVLIYFPTEVEYEGVTFPNNSLALLDRNHGVVIKVRCDITTSDCYVVNFDEDLDSKLSNIRSLGNLLNTVIEETQSTTVESIKIEYHQLMDENVDAGLDAPPSKEQNAVFLRRYAFINSNSLKNFVSSHKTGGRKKPVKTWSTPELSIEHSKITKRYPEWLVMSPMGCAEWKGERVGLSTWDSMDELKDKIIFIMHAKTVNQSKKDYQDKIVKRFVNWSEEYNREVKIIFLGSK